MLKFWELKKIVDKPAKRKRIPTAKYLKEAGVPVISKRLERDAQITVYSNGYALYQVNRHTTVFPIHLCGDYLYISSDNEIHVPKNFLDKEPWYIRLILEGEDRINKNLEEREQRRTVSYSAISEEWEVIEDFEKSVLEILIRQETMDEMMRILTRRQRMVLQAFFLQEKTQKQISSELNLSKASVYVTISQAICRIRENYLDEGYGSKKAGSRNRQMENDVKFNPQGCRFGQASPRL